MAESQSPERTYRVRYACGFERQLKASWTPVIEASRYSRPFEGLCPEHGIESITTYVECIEHARVAD